MRVAVKHLTTSWLGRPLIYREEIGSTNTHLAKLAAEGAPTGAVVVAGYQTHGRGRGDHRWLAPPHTSLLFSVLLRPNWPAGRTHWLTMLAGMALLAAIEEPLQTANAQVTAALKWPNDIMLRIAADPTWRKIGGILLETQLRDDRLQQAIIGMGLNVNIAPDALPPGDTPSSSLLAATGRTFPLPPLLAAVLQQLEHGYEQADAGRSPQAEWDARLITRNRRVRVVTAQQTVEGRALGTDEWGRLLVRDTSGKTHAFTAANVTLLAPPA